MNACFPIEQLVTCTDASQRSQFFPHARSLLAGVDGVSLEPARHGLLLLAQSETVLDEAGRILRDAFGDTLRFSASEVRLHHEDGWQQPIMGFRIVAAPPDVGPISGSLARRSARIDDVEVRSGSGVIRGQAPLTRLLGYPRTLSRLSSGTAHATFWLSHYQPLWSYSSETMACYSE